MEGFLGKVAPKWSFDEDKWELYNVEEDFSECHDLAEKQPEKLRQLHRYVVG